MSLRIPNPFDSREDWRFYEQVYGCVDFHNKVVLDLGADAGSTADYFLQKGAVRVFAVEGDEGLFAQLRQNIKTVLQDEQFERVRPFRCQIQDPETLAGILFQAQPQVVKMDLDSEGHIWEHDLVPKLPDNVLRIAGEWLVECHQRYTLNDVAARMRLAGFMLKRDALWSPPNTSVAYFKLM